MFTDPAGHHIRKAVLQGLWEACPSKPFMLLPGGSAPQRHASHRCMDPCSFVPYQTAALWFLDSATCYNESCTLLAVIENIPVPSAVTVQLANELKGEGFTIIAMHPGGRCSLQSRTRSAARTLPPTRRHATQSRRRTLNESLTDAQRCKLSS